MPKKTAPPKTIPGPKPEMLKIEGKWQDAVKQSFEKKKPVAWWPKE
jgi:hypothetical protein